MLSPFNSVISSWACYASLAKAGLCRRQGQKYALALVASVSTVQKKRIVLIVLESTIWWSGGMYFWVVYHKWEKSEHIRYNDRQYAYLVSCLNMTSFHSSWFELALLATESYISPSSSYTPTTATDAKGLVGKSNGPNELWMTCLPSELDHTAKEYAWPSKALLWLNIDPELETDSDLRPQWWDQQEPEKQWPPFSATSNAFTRSLSPTCLPYVVPILPWHTESTSQHNSTSMDFSHIAKFIPDSI